MMEKSKKYVFRRTIPAYGLVLFALGVMVYERLIARGAVPLSEFSSIRLGFCGGMLAAGLFMIYHDLMLMRVPERMKTIYIADCDERKIAIRAKAGMPVVLYLSVAMVMAAVVASYMNMTVCYTLLIAAVTQMLIGCGLKLYYTRTM